MGMAASHTDKISVGGGGAPGGIVFLPLLIAKGEVGGKEYRKLDGPPQGKQ